VIVTGVALGVCVTAAVLGFSVREYWVGVPMDCVASRTEADELPIYQMLQVPGWAYNVALTRSDLIEFRPGLGAPRGPFAVPVAAR
jgi:hypothetical protein